MHETRIETVGNLKYSMLYKWGQNDPLTRFIVCMLAAVIPAILVATSAYGAVASLTVLVWWIGVVFVAAYISKRWLL